MHQVSSVNAYGVAVREALAFKSNHTVCRQEGSRPCLPEQFVLRHKAGAYTHFANERAVFVYPQLLIWLVNDHAVVLKGTHHHQPSTGHIAANVRAVLVAPYAYQGEIFPCLQHLQALGLPMHRSQNGTLGAWFLIDFLMIGGLDVHRHQWGIQLFQQLIRIIAAGQQLPGQVNGFLRRRSRLHIQRERKDTVFLLLAVNAAPVNAWLHPPLSGFPLPWNGKHALIRDGFPHGYHMLRPIRIGINAQHHLTLAADAAVHHPALPLVQVICFAPGEGIFQHRLRATDAHAGCCLQISSIRRPQLRG